MSVNRPGLDTPAKRDAALGYLDTLEALGRPDAVLRDRIDRLRAELLKDASLCVKCERGEHHLCWGYDGPMTTHPDSLPLCTCDHREGQP